MRMAGFLLPLAGESELPRSGYPATQIKRSTTSLDYSQPFSLEGLDHPPYIIWDFYQHLPMGHIGGRQRQFRQRFRLLGIKSESAGKAHYRLLHQLNPQPFSL